MIDRETLTAAYLQRFGSQRSRYDNIPATLARRLEERDATRLSFVVTFQPPDRPDGPIVYASIGASREGGGNEIFLEATSPFSTFESVVEHLAEAAPRGLAPLQIVPALLRLTPFDAVIVLPAEDGSFPLAGLDGTPGQVLRIAPVTRAERLLGEREPERLIERLRAAGALVADPFRACVVEPTRDGSRRANLAELLRQERMALSRSTARLERGLALNVPDILIEGAELLAADHRARLSWLESRVPEVFPDPDPPELREEDERVALHVRVTDEVLASCADPCFAFVPRRVARLFRTFTFLATTRHPLITPLRHETVNGEGREEANDPRTDEGGRLAIFIDLLAGAMPHMFPTSKLKETRKHARKVVKQAMSTLDPANGDPWEVQLWSITATAVCLHAAPLEPEERAAAARALYEAGDRVAPLIAEYGSGPVPARLRLERIAVAIAATLVFAFTRPPPTLH